MQRAAHIVVIIFAAHYPLNSFGLPRDGNLAAPFHVPHTAPLFCIGILTLARSTYLLGMFYEPSKPSIHRVRLLVVESGGIGLPLARRFFTHQLINKNDVPKSEDHFSPRTVILVCVGAKDVAVVIR